MSTAGLPPEEVQYQEAHAYEDYTRNLGGFYIVVVFLTFISVVLRVFSRRITKQELKADDWIYITGAILAEGSYFVLLIYAFDAGLGAHWALLTTDQQALFRKLNFAYNILNVVNYPLIKISILLLYRRIFVSRIFHGFVWAAICFVGSVGIAMTLVAVFSCMPVQSFYDPSVSGTCIDSVSFYMASAILNAIHDFLILALPLPLVWRLQTTTRRKLAISSLFVIGGLTFVISILRLAYYFQYTALDPSYSFLATAFAAPAEVCLATLVASATTWMPTWRVVRKLVRETFDGLRSRRGRGAGSSSSQKPSYSNVGVLIGKEKPVDTDATPADKRKDASTTKAADPTSAQQKREKKQQQQPHRTRKWPPHWMRTSAITPIYLDRKSSQQDSSSGSSNGNSSNSTTSSRPGSSNPTSLSKTTTLQKMPTIEHTDEDSNPEHSEKMQRSNSEPTLVEASTNVGSGTDDAQALETPAPAVLVGTAMGYGEAPDSPAGEAESEDDSRGGGLRNLFGKIKVERHFYIRSERRSQPVASDDVGIDADARGVAKGKGRR